MPTRPLRYCVGRCGALVESGRCAECQRKLEQRRGSAAKRNYGRRHQAQRLIILARDPICRGCERAPSTVDDHIIPIESGGSATDGNNQQGLCADCHGWKTAKEIRDPFLGLRLREAGSLINEPAPKGWRYDPQFGGVNV